MSQVKCADWVTTKNGGNGFVKRLSRNGSWATVLWRDPELGEWVKRMPTRTLIVRHTLPRPGGWTVTDLDREDERPTGFARKGEKGENNG